MHIDLWTLGLQAINVLVLIWLLSRFLFRPVVAIVAQRRQAAEALLADAEAARNQARAEAAAIAQQRQALDAEANCLRAAAHAEAETDRTAQLAKTQAEIAQARQEGEAQLARERAQQQKALETRACALAVEIARRLLTRVPAASVTTALVQRLVQDIAALPSTEQQALTAEATQLRLITAVELDAPALAAITAALTDALGTVPRLDPQVDPSLLGGIELIGPHTLIRNSWRADLDRVARDLTAEHADAA